jgi:N-formylglutamate amidohydrolase
MLRFALQMALIAVAATAPLPRIEAQDKPEPEKFLVAKPGTLPIILSVPHGGRTAVPDVPVRRGFGVPKFTTVRDENTLELAEKLADAIEKELGGRPYVVVALFDRKYLDVNRPPEDAYETAKAKPYYDAYHGALGAYCAQVRKTWGRGLLLDLHGQALMNDTIYRGTQNLKSVSALKQRYGMKAINGPNSICGVLEANGYTIFPPSDARDSTKENPFFSGGYIIETYGSDAGTGIDAMQLELPGKLRMRAALDTTAADLAGAVKVFAKEYLPAEKLPAKR